MLGCTSSRASILSFEAPSGFWGQREREEVRSVRSQEGKHKHLKKDERGGKLRTSFRLRLSGYYPECLLCAGSGTRTGVRRVLQGSCIAASSVSLIRLREVSLMWPKPDIHQTDCIWGGWAQGFEHQPAVAVCVCVCVSVRDYRAGSRLWGLYMTSLYHDVLKLDSDQLHALIVFMYLKSLVLICDCFHSNSSLTETRMICACNQWSVRRCVID